MDLSDLVQVVQQNPALLSGLSLSDLLHFVDVTTTVYPFIAWMSSNSTIERQRVPDMLPDNVTALLLTSLNMSVETSQGLWAALRHCIAHHRAQHQDGPATHGPLLEAGVRFHLACKEFFPPLKACQYHLCPAFLSNGTRTLLTEAKRHQATLFSQQGALPVYTSSLMCRSCLSRYYLNYAVRPTLSQRDLHTRDYYPGMPEYLQIAKHVFIERGVCSWFKKMAVFVHASAQGIARVYNLSIGSPEQMPESWSTAVDLRSEVVSDCFDLFSLLQHHDKRGTMLSIPHEAPDQATRLRVAMEHEIGLTAAIGQEHWAHACTLCLEVKERDGERVRIHAAVMDGINMGHPACGVRDCQEALINNHRRFCKSHVYLEAQCGVVGCENDVEEGFKSCKDPQHRRRELRLKEENRSMTQLQKRARRAGVLLAHESIADDTDECTEKDERGKDRVRVQFGRNWTHNEQLMVWTCGVIAARGTMFGSEALIAAVDFAKAVFPTPEALPDVIFYDSNCCVMKHLNARQDHYFDQCKLPVDVFHFRAKHKESDEFCGQYCNPRLFGDLITEHGRWRFNSSAAEQANVWFGGHTANVREMGAVRYAFYLDECIAERNRFTVAELARKGHAPFLMPHESLFPNPDVSGPEAQ